MEAILIIENKDSFSLQESLLRRVMCIHSTFQNAIEQYKKQYIDLVIINSTIPSESLLDLCCKFREFSLVPIIVIFDQHKVTTTNFLVKALIQGADDCIKLPVHTGELQARVEAVIRRTRRVPLSHQGENILSFNKDSFEIEFSGNKIHLAPKEYSLLEALISYPNRTRTLEQLITSIWGEDEINTRTVHSYIRNIRDKFRIYGFPIDQYLLTVWGIGYRWVTSPLPNGGEE